MPGSQAAASATETAIQEAPRAETADERSAREDLIEFIVRYLNPTVHNFDVLISKMILIKLRKKRLIQLSIYGSIFQSYSMPKFHEARQTLFIAGDSGTIREMPFSTMLEYVIIIRSNYKGLYVDVVGSIY